MRPRFAGSRRSGKHVAMLIIHVIQPVLTLNGHDPHADLKDVLTLRPTQRASEIAELLPQPMAAGVIKHGGIAGRLHNNGSSSFSSASAQVIF